MWATGLCLGQVQNCRFYVQYEVLLKCSALYWHSVHSIYISEERLNNKNTSLYNATQFTSSINCIPVNQMTKHHLHKVGFIAGLLYYTAFFSKVYLVKVVNTKCTVDLIVTALTHILTLLLKWKKKLFLSFHLHTVAHIDQVKRNYANLLIIRQCICKGIHTLRFCTPNYGKVHSMF